MPIEVRVLNIAAPPIDDYGSRAAVSIGAAAADLQLGRRQGHSIRARASLRLGLAGGGADLSPYRDKYGVTILNATIGRYAYAHLSFRDDHRIYFSAHDVEQDDVVPLAAELPLDNGLLLHRAVYNRIVRDFLRAEFTQSLFRRRLMLRPVRAWARHPRWWLRWSRPIVPHLACRCGTTSLAYKQVSQ